MNIREFKKEIKGYNGKKVLSENALLKVLQWEFF